MLLRKDDPWNAKLPIPDIRNWRVVDRQNVLIGFVESLVVDPRENIFEALFTGANERFHLDEIEIGEHVVCVTRPLERGSDADPTSTPGGGTFDHAYRDHFTSVYGEEADFDAYADAYQFGREMAGDADFAGLTAAAAHEDLEARHAASGLHPPYEIVRDAVHFGYTLARGPGHLQIADK